MSEKLKIVFMPGCFDGFEGTQEELDSLTAELTAKFEDGSLLEESEPVDLSEMLANGEEELVEHLLPVSSDENKRRLH